VPWGGIDLELQPLRLSGVSGWDGVAAAVAQEWLGHVGRTQAHKFIAGVAPIRSVVRVGGAVAGLLAVPATSIGGAVSRQIAGGGGGPGGGGGGGAGGGGLAAATVAAAEPLWALVDGEPGRQLRRSAAGFVRALVFEALGVGATVAAGAQVVLAGGAPAPAVEPPPSVSAALRAAGAELSAGFGAAREALAREQRAARRGASGGDRWRDAALRALRAAPAAAAPAASATAAAVRYALLGMRSALDPDRAP
jgi:hypothetical protein